jgi:transcriptional regulator of NAD metabolism
MILNSFLKLYQQRDTCSEQQQYLRTSLLYPGSPACLHPMFETNIELAKYIDRHYRVTEQIGDYYIMERMS